MYAESCQCSWYDVTGVTGLVDSTLQGKNAHKHVHSLLASLYRQQLMVVCSTYTEALVKMRNDDKAYELHTAAVAALKPYDNLGDQPFYARIHKAQKKSYSRAAKKDRHGHSS